MYDLSFGDEHIANRLGSGVPNGFSGRSVPALLSRCFVVKVKASGPPHVLSCGWW